MIFSFRVVGSVRCVYETFSAPLTIRRLGEALLQPRLPDKGDCMTFDFSLPASTYLEEDLARLDRICR